MATNKKFASPVISKLEACLKELKIKSESKSTNDEALIYGKFSIDKAHYRIVVHVQKEEYVPNTNDFGTAKYDQDKEDCQITPNLDLQTTMSRIKPLSEEEGLKVKKDFLERAAKILPKIKR